MEAIYNEIASGKDTGFQDLIKTWEIRCQDCYERIQNDLHIDLNALQDPDVSLDYIKAQNIDTQTVVDQLRHIIRLRASLITELDEITKLRIELEDSESISEVHIALYRVNAEKRRLDVELRKTKEQCESSLVDHYGLLFLFISIFSLCFFEFIVRQPFKIMWPFSST
ncbi:unnamed protein product [Protopolystoma xenopodis]|uniref:Uncharacterized protein n=1 Tax=Protopolystoma xenopodis TaxID=117903 RepID=A0A3S5B3H8_9PLAT|nr:unnamed protein product [Protopolystoma xenopodis]